MGRSAGVVTDKSDRVWGGKDEMGRSEGVKGEECKTVVRAGQLTVEGSM